ncbi:OsmC family peroxiredoxin [bacterium]|nr:MAG: OsmC family peroxiredoxin [bacterium]
MTREHRYTTTVTWTGNSGTGTSSYRAYDRSNEIAAAGKPAILASSDPHFRGDAARYNPEELLVAALSSCHMLSYLHVCASAGIVVTRYVDAAEGSMTESGDGGGHFTRVVLHPQITVQAGADLAQARALHHDAQAKCFIANSVNFPVECEPSITAE